MRQDYDVPPVAVPAQHVHNKYGDALSVSNPSQKLAVDSAVFPVL